MNQLDSTRNIWDTVGIICFLNIICFGSFYLCSVYLTEVTLIGGDQNVALTFILGYFARPLGALIFGLRADLRGIERTLRESILLLIIATAGMAFLNKPATDTYLNAFIRILQGIGLGGSYACMAVLLFEVAPHQKKGQVTSLFQSSVPIGYLTALLLTIVIRLLFPDPTFEKNAWRVTFFFPLVTYFALRLFRPITSLPRNQNPPIQDYWKQIIHIFTTITKHWRLLGGPALLSIAVGALAFTLENYRFYFMKVILNINPQVVDFSSAVSTLLFLPFYFLGGWLLDHTKAQKLFIAFALCATILAIPGFQILESLSLKIPPSTAYQSWLHPATLNITLALFIMNITSSVPFGALVAFICRQFPPSIRCFMFAFTYSLGVGVVGGITHLYGSLSFYAKEDKYSGIYFAVIVSFICVVTSYLFHFFRASNTQDAGTQGLS